MGLLIEIGFHPIGLFLGEQARIRMCVSETQAPRTCEHLFDRHAPFMGKGFNPLSSHLFYVIPTGLNSPAVIESIPLFHAARQRRFCASTSEIPSPCSAQTATNTPRSDGDSRRAPAAAAHRQAGSPHPPPQSAP